MMLFKPLVPDTLLVKDVTVGESGREKEQPQLTGPGSDVDQHRRRRAARLAQSIFIASGCIMCSESLAKRQSSWFCRVCKHIKMVN